MFLIDFQTLGCVDEDFKNINLNTNNNRNRTEDFQFKQALIDDQIRAIKAMMKQNKTESSSSSSMRSTRASSSGTGVFLPTRTGSASSYSSDQSKRAGNFVSIFSSKLVFFWFFFICLFKLLICPNSCWSWSG